MTINEAIEIKERKGEEFLNTDPDDIDEAERLSIEALKRIRACRKVIDIPCTRPLLGEVLKPIHDSRRPDPRYPGILLLDD